MSHAPAPRSSWSRPPMFGHHAPAAWQQHGYPPAYRVQPAALPRRSSTTAPALYVLGSFALMLVLAALTSVFGSFAALALIGHSTDDADDTTEVAPPAASLTTR